MTKNYNSSKSNTSSVRGEDGLTPDGGGGGEDPMTKNYNSSKSNTSSVSEAPLAMAAAVVGQTIYRVTSA